MGGKKGATTDAFKDENGAQRTSPLLARQQGFCLAPNYQDVGREQTLKGHVQTQNQPMQTQPPDHNNHTWDTGAAGSR